MLGFWSAVAGASKGSKTKKTFSANTEYSERLHQGAPANAEIEMGEDIHETFDRLSRFIKRYIQGADELITECEKSVLNLRTLLLKKENNRATPEQETAIDAVITALQDAFSTEFHDAIADILAEGSKRNKKKFTKAVRVEFEQRWKCLTTHLDYYEKGDYKIAPAIRAAVTASIKAATSKTVKSTVRPR